MTNARRRGKEHEKATAKRLNGKRVGCTGLATEDVALPGPWSVECKSREFLPKWLTAAMRQAKVNAPEGKTAIVILHQTGSRHANDIVCMRLADFEEWHGEFVHGEAMRGIERVLIGEKEG